MASGLPSAQQPFASPQPAPVSSAAAAQTTSPPTKANLKSWWKGFSKAPSKAVEKPGRYCHFRRPWSLTSPPQLFNSRIPRNLVSVFREGYMDEESPVAESIPSEVLSDVATARRLSLEDIFEDPETPATKNIRKRESKRSILGDMTNKPVPTGSSVASGHEQVKRFASIRAPSRAQRQSSDPYSFGDLHSRSTTALGSSDRRKTFSSSTLRLSGFFSRTFRDDGTKSIMKLAEQPTGIFGVPLRQSITYANVAISLVDAEGKSYIYGYVPIIVAKCGVYLKEKATNVEGIFRLSGSEKRIKELRLIFDSPDRYGKGLDWAGYTVHDAANVLRRYLNMLPEPTIPLELYERFREPLKGHVMNKGGDAEGPHFLENFDVNKAITTYQQLITELPPLNRQLLLYILDLLAVFASKSDENRMDSRNLAAIFQPGMLTHPQHDMIPEEYLLSQDVLVFLIENQDHFLIGMRGTAADEKTVQEVQRGSTPPPGTPTTPGRSKTTMARSASNGSAGAYSVRKDGGLRRNVSVSSRHSRQSNGAPSPASPALTQSTSGGVHRSNTVPSKRSPALRADRLQKNSGSPSSPSPTTAGPPVHGGATRGISPGAPGAPVASGNRSLSSSSPGLTPTASSHAAALTSQERLIPDSSHPEVATPAKERNITAIFNRSPTGETEKKPPNKLRKKRLPGSSNPSAQSSTHSLTAPSPALQPILSQEAVEQQYLENTPSSNPTVQNTTATPPATAETTPRAAEHPLKSRPDEAHNSDKTLKPITSPPSSLHSRSSYNDQSDFDQIDDITAAAERKEKRSLWRLSRRKDDSQTLGNTLSTKKGSDNGAAQSSSTVGSSSRPRKSFTGDSLPASSDPTLVSAHMQSSNENGPFVDEKKGPIGWLKTKMEKRREEKEAKEERNKSPPAGTDRAPNMSSPALPARAKSMDVKREQPHPEKAAEQPAAQQQP